MSETTRAVEQLTFLSATELARCIAGGEVSSREAVDAHIARIEEVNPRLNAVVLPRYEIARREADAVDAARLRGEPLGPLAGVPISIKECFDVAGMVATIGVEGFGRAPAREDSPLVARLREAGAIVIGKTNVPQLMVMHETDNPIYGRTNNPWDLERSPGGSSGGEAAVIATGGSPLGLGNDIGGSIRHPAHSCGICGLKPTTGRLTNMGAVHTFRGLEAVGVQAGPLARSVDDVTLGLQILGAPGMETVDMHVAAAPWRDPDAVDVSGLRIAMWTDDGYFAPAPALRRAVEEAAAALRAQGAEVESIVPPDVSEAMRLYLGLLSADGSADLRRLVGRSRRDRRVAKLFLLGRVPAWLRSPLAGILEMIGHRRDAELLRSIGAISADRYWQLTYARMQYVNRFAAQLAAARYDAVICPPHALPALRHGSAEFLTIAASYQMLFNLLGMPAGIVPVTRVRGGEESDRSPSRDPTDREAIAVETGSAGLPIGVQVAAPWWREDIVLAVMKAIESHCRNEADDPWRPAI